MPFKEYGTVIEEKPAKKKFKEYGTVVETKEPLGKKISEEKREFKQFGRVVSEPQVAKERKRIPYVSGIDILTGGVGPFSALRRVAEVMTPEQRQATAELGLRTFGRVAGAVGWPFMRAEYGIATPIAGFQEAAKEVGYKTYPIYRPDLQIKELIENRELIGPIISKAMPKVKTGLKSFIPFTRVDPEKVKTLSDVGADYYEELTGEEAPAWWKNMFGTSSSFLTTPFIVSKYMKGLAVGINAIRNTEFLSRMRMPDMRKYQAMKNILRVRTIGKKGKAYEIGETLVKGEIDDIAKDLSKKAEIRISPQTVKLRLGQLIKGGISEQKALRELANPVINEFETVAKEAKKLKILPEYTYVTKLSKRVINNLRQKKIILQSQLNKLQTRKRFPGRTDKIRALQKQIGDVEDRIQTSYKLGGTKYLPRMYQTMEEAKLTRRIPIYAPTRIRAQYAKARKKISFEIRKEMREIQEPGFPTLKRLIQIGTDVENSRHFKRIARNPNWISDTAKVGLAKEPLPNVKAYGALAGKYVHSEIYKDVKALVGIRNNFVAYYDAMIGTWKLGKVVLNPATHFRNMFTNSILLDLSGMDHIQQVKYLTRAVKEIKINSQEFKFASHHLGRTGMISSELLDDMLSTVKATQGTAFAKLLSGYNKFIKKVTREPVKIYQQEEFISKFMKYLQMRERGWSRMRSLREANKWLFDYGDLTLWEQQIMRRIMPFYTFPRKALPRVFEAAINNPYAIAKYPLLAWVETKHALSKLRMTDKDYANLQQSLPEFMQRGSFLLLPWRDQNGDLQFLDWTYLVPWGELYEAEHRGLLKTVITNPLLQVWSDIVHNKSSWTGREIWYETDTPQEKFAKKLLYTWRQAVPNLTPGGIYWDKLYKAIAGIKYGWGRRKIPSIPKTIAHTIFGIRLLGISPDEQKRFEQFGARDKLKELGNKARRNYMEYQAGNISRKKYERLNKQYRKQVKEIRERLSR